MKKYQKRIALDYVRLLEQIQDAVKQLLGNGDRETVSDLLGQCQEAAVQLGTLIEETEGEDFTTVKMLEEYCELAFFLHASLMQKPSSDVYIIHEQMQEQLVQIQVILSP